MPPGRMRRQRLDMYGVIALILMACGREMEGCSLAKTGYRGQEGD